MQGSFVIFGSLYILLLALLFVPVRLHAAATATLRGGRGELTIRYLFLSMRFLIRIHGLEYPQLSVEFLNKDGGVRSLTHLLDREDNEKPKWPQAVLHAARAKKLMLLITLGIAGCPAATALLCATAASAAEEAAALLIPETRTQVQTVPIWNQNVFRINLEGIVSVRLVKVIKERIALKGVK